MSVFWTRVRRRGLGVRALAAYLAIVFSVAVVAPGLAFSADTGGTTIPPETTVTPAPTVETSAPPADPVVVETPAPVTPPVDPVVQAVAPATPPIVPLVDVLPPGSFSKTFEQFANKTGSEQWINGAVQQNKAVYAEGMSVPQRLILTGIDTGGGAHSVTFEHQFTKGGKYAYDFITSWTQARTAANNIIGQTWQDNWKWMGIDPAVKAALDNYSVDVTVPGNGRSTARENAYQGALGYGARTLTVYSDQPITGVTVTMDPALYGDIAGDSSLRFTVTWTGPAQGVMILYASHIANGIDPYLPKTGIGWGAGTGASSISGAPYHNMLSSSTEWSGGSSMDNQLMAASIGAMSGITGLKYHDLTGDGAYPPTAGETGLSGWQIWADLNNNGVYDAGIDKMTTTIANGTYGLYFILPVQAATDVHVYEVIPPASAWQKTYPTTAYHTVNVSPGQEVSGVDFGNWEHLLPTVSVTKTANPTTVPETGGSVTFTFRITNTGPVAFTVTSISDDRFGNLLPTAKAQNGGADIVIPSTNPDSYYQFTYTTTLASDTLTPHTNWVTVGVISSHGDTASAQDDATVTFTDVPPTIHVTKTASPSSVPETGGSVTFTFRIYNTGTESVTVTSISDDRFGNLLPTAKAQNGGADIVIPSTNPDSYYQFTYTTTLASDTLTAHTNRVDVTAVDNDGSQATDFATATVTFTDVPPTIHVTKTASPSSVPETGGSVTFTFRIYNTGTESVTVTSISDDRFGNLLPTAKAQNGGADIVIPSTNPDSYYQFTYTTTLASDTLTAHTNRVDVTAVDNDGSQATDFATATVTFTDVPPTVAVAKVATPLYMIMPGGTFSYTATVTNTSPERVQVMSVTDDVAGVVYQWSAGDPEIWLDPAQSRAFTFTFDHKAPGTYPNTVTAMVRDNDGSTATATASASVIVTNPKISVVKSSDAPPGGVQLGASTLVTYKFVVTNTGDVTLYNVVVTDDKLGVVGTIAVFPVAAVETFTKSTTLTDGVTNVVTAIGYDEHENQVKDTDTLTIDSYLRYTVLDLAITKTANRATASSGDLIIYTLTYWNNGELPATGYSIVDDFDERYVTIVDAGGGTVANGTITWKPAGSLAVADGKKTITYTVRVVASMPAGKTNIDNVVVISDPKDIDLSNNTARARVVVDEPFLPFTGAEYLLLILAAIITGMAGLVLRPVSHRRS